MPTGRQAEPAINLDAPDIAGSQARTRMDEPEWLVKLREHPHAIILRLRFTYGVEGEMFIRAPERQEAIGLFFAAGSAEADLDPKMGKALRGAGVEWFEGLMASRWRAVTVDEREAPHISLDMREHLMDVGCRRPAPKALAL